MPDDINDSITTFGGLRSDQNPQTPPPQQPAQPAFNPPPPPPNAHPPGMSQNRPPRPMPPPPNRPPQQSPREAPQIHKPPLLWTEVQTIFKNLEQKLQGKVIGYFAGAQIVADDVKYFYSHLRDLGHQSRLFFILYSRGGDGKSAYRIASLLKEYCDELIVIVPEMAASAATMLSLAGDTILMTPLSYFTAVDTSLTHPLNPKDKGNNPVSIELEEVKRAVEVLAKGQSEQKDSLEVYKTIFTYIHPAAFGAMERTTNLSEMLCRDILELRRQPMDPDTANKLIDKLNHDYPTHVYPITKRKARSLGLNVVDTDEELNSILWQYININTYLTEPVRTDFNESAFHQERVLNIIESAGRRLFVMNMMERRLDPIIKGWTTLRDEYKWFSVSEVMEDGKPSVRISNLDL